jgi:ubiquinone/menaquinone biosynthesis C-methylase UbiE
MAAELVRRGGAPRELVMLDRSPQMLARAPADLGRRMPGDARALPFADGRFDLVSLAFLVHLLPLSDAVAALAEAGRVLAPGGRVLVVGHSSPRGRPGRAYRAAWVLLGRHAPWLVAGGGPIEDAVPLLEEAGLRPLREIRAPGVYWSQSLTAAPRQPSWSYSALQLRGAPGGR